MAKKTTCEKYCQKEPLLGGGTSGQATRGTCRLGQSRQEGAAIPKAGKRVHPAGVGIGGMAHFGWRSSTALPARKHAATLRGSLLTNIFRGGPFWHYVGAGGPMRQKFAWTYMVWYKLLNSNRFFLFLLLFSWPVLFYQGFRIWFGVGSFWFAFFFVILF
jgi:hypothetical protein